MAETQAYVYIARRACGHVLAACTDVPQFRKQAAKEIAAWIREGRTVERIPADELHFDLKEHREQCLHQEAANQGALAL